MGPDADEPFYRKSLKWPQGLEDTPHPAGHLSGRVDVVGLCVLGEALLKWKKRIIFNIFIYMEKKVSNKTCILREM